MPVDRWVGQALGGRYQIEELLGRGGMSAVYKARDPNLQRTVAVKMIHPHLTGDEEFIRRFESEAAVIARLRHQNIVQVYDFNHEGDLYYMVLEYVAGETLQNRIKRLSESGRRLPIRETLKYIIQVCQAADYAHQRGMIHRDIKPANVMLDVSGNAILMDFGIAHILGGHQHTATGAVLGTALYMSPEQIQGLHPDARADIYSIGVTLFEALSGRPPFEADSVMTVMMMHMNDPVPDLSQLNPDIPQAVKEVVNHALEKDRARRFQSCAEMAAALQQALEQTGEVQAAAPQRPVAPVQREVKPAASPETRIETPPALGSLSTIIEPAAPAASPAGAVETIIEPVSTAAPRPGSQTGPVALVPPAVPGAGKKILLWTAAAALLLALMGGSYFAYNQFLKPRSTPQPAVAGARSTQTLANEPTQVPPTPLAAAGKQQEPDRKPEVSPSPTATDTPAPTATTTPEPVPTDTPAPTALPVIGGADMLAYLLESNIWLANVDGSEVRQITTDGAAKKYLRWLPDRLTLSYISGKCIQMVDIYGTTATLTCFNNSTYLDSFDVSPDGSRVALSLDHQLYLLPFDLEKLSKADSHPDLVAMADCLDLAPYQRNAAVSARWARDGKLLSAVTLGVLANGQRGDVVQLFAVDRCIPNPLVQVQFPPPHFNFGEYSRSPSLPGFTWDGEYLYVMNGNTRNEGFGHLHLFNRETFRASTAIDPINSACCYRDPQFSPDGEYLIFAFQDISLGADSKTQLYYIPFGSIGTGAKYQPLPLPENTNPREAPQPALRPAASE